MYDGSETLNSVTTAGSTNLDGSSEPKDDQVDASTVNPTEQHQASLEPDTPPVATAFMVAPPTNEGQPTKATQPKAPSQPTKAPRLGPAIDRDTTRRQPAISNRYVDPFSSEPDLPTTPTAPAMSIFGQDAVRDAASTNLQDSGYTASEEGMVNAGSKEGEDWTDLVKNQKENFSAF